MNAPRLVKNHLYSLAFVLLLFALIFATSILYGHVAFDPEIIWAIRLPRVVLAACCGAALALAGWLCQGLFRNPLATPSVLGIESCAAFLGASWSLWSHNAIGLWSLPFATAIGSCLLTSALVICARNSARAHTRLLILGFSLNALFGALTSFAVALISEDQPRDGTLMLWLFGDLASRDWIHVGMAGGAIILAVPLARKCVFPLQILAMGREHALNAGIDLKTLSTIALLSCGILVGGSTAAAGSIPFVGFVAPLLTRRFFGSNHRLLPWACMVNGASLVCAADLVARTIRHPYDLHVGLVVALVGTPIFIMSVLMNPNKSGTFS